MATGFFAYPESSPIVTDAITGAVDLSAGESLRLKPWQKMRIVGFKLDELIREQIIEADVLVADVTYPNANVLYEIGFAAAVGKPVIPTVNIAIEKSVERMQRLGLFDTIGWATYNNGEELSGKLRDWNEISWSNRYSRKRDHVQPMFILDTLKKTDFRNHIFHAVEHSEVNFRKFDPSEIPRLTAAQAIAEISSSAGVIIPLISEEIVDAYLHNLRASFLLGLAHGFQIEPLVIQYEHAPVPLDYRDFVTNSTFRRETESHVSAYCAATLVQNQRASGRDRTVSRGVLAQIDLGSPAAENENQQLSYYFVETAEFARALRAEGAVVTGRKGSGKTAIFLQVVDRISRDRANCIVDLRPASHNLSEMRQALLSVMSAGVFDHTIAAFWQYVLYVEILLKIRETVLKWAKNDFRLQQRVREIEENFSLSENIVSGDFTSRLESVIRDVVRAVESNDSSTDLRSQLTNIMFESPIPRLRDAILSFTDFFGTIIILIDDLDKGWPPRQVEEHDVATIKHLIEVLNRIQRDLRRRGIQFRHLVFLRSDIYERLVEVTSDRGKYNIIKVDWSDPEQLRHMLRKRVVSAVDPKDREAAWSAINPSLGARDAVDAMIDSSLRRPRFLIDLYERTLSVAINRGHQTVSKEDVEEGMRQMSLYLVSDFGYELRDVAGTPEDIFYSFIGRLGLLTSADLSQILSADRLGLGLEQTVDLLLWYGFLGIVGSSDEAIFIYDRAYDFRRLTAERAPNAEEVLYVVNPAFLKGLTR